MKAIKVVSYHQIPIILSNEREGYVVVNQKDRMNLYKNKYLYIQNKKIEYEMLEDQKIKERNEYQITIKLSKKIKQKEMVMMTIENKKISVIDMMINAWGGDKNR
jgi:UTP-glucose-1-phosphate uridylyltransferase